MSAAPPPSEFTPPDYDHFTRRALCTLARVPQLSATLLQTALGRAGSLDALLAADLDTLRSWGLPPNVARALLAVDVARIDVDVLILERTDITVIGAHETAYPERLREIPDAPAVLFVRGNVTLLNAPQIAIVGSRNPTANGQRTARDFAWQLAGCGLGITSGLALGIDAASHEGALLAGGFTIAVCATGLDLMYPAQHAALAERIVASGALISEFPPETSPRPHHFPQRNRLISGLAIGVLVVEAARRSGSLATARCAGEQGREVFAIPGSIHSPLSHGCHALIRQGAKLVEGIDDILSELPLSQSKQWVSNASNPPEPSPHDGPRLDNPAEILLDALGFEPTSVDSLIASTGLSSTSVASLLLTLDLEGRVASDGFGRYFRVTSLPRGGPAN